jgi:hypothetical protein
MLWPLTTGWSKALLRVGALAPPTSGRMRTVYRSTETGSGYNVKLIEPAEIRESASGAGGVLRGLIETRKVEHPML